MIELALYLVAILVILGVYLNLGWALALYYLKKIDSIPKRDLKGLAKILAGGWAIFSHYPWPPSMGINRLFRRASFLWPVRIVAVLLSWIAWSLWQIFLGLCYIAIFVKRAIFDGGIVTGVVKLFGSKQ